MRSVTDLVADGVLEIHSLDSYKLNEAFVNKGKSNIIRYKKLKRELREFMLNNFEKQDFFFGD